MAVNELTTAYVSVAASAQGLQSSIAKELSPLGKMGDKIGKQIAKGINKTTSENIDVNALAAEVEKVEKKIAAESERSRLIVEKATRKAEIAQRKYNETVKKYGKETSQAAQAEDRLIDAQQKRTAETVKAKRAVADLNDELDKTRQAHEKGKDAAEAYTKGWRGMGKRIGGHVVAAVAIGGVAGKLAAGKEGEKAGNAYTRNFGSAVARLSGLRVLKDLGSNFGSGLMNLDKSVPKIAATTMALGLLSSVAVVGAGNIFALAGSVASIAPAALALPAIFAGVAIGVGVFAMAMADVKTVLGDLGPAFGSLQDSVSGAFWATAAQPIRDMVYNLMPLLTTHLTTIATHMGGWAVAITDVVNSAEGIGFITNILENATVFADKLSDGIGAMAGGLLQLTSVGAQYLPDFAGWINKISFAFQAWVQESANNGNLNKWIDTGIENLKHLGRVITGLGGIFAGMARAMADAGGASLRGLADGLHEVSDAINGPIGQGVLRSVFESAGRGVDGLMVGVRALGPALVAIGPTLGRAMEVAGESVGTLLTGISAALSRPEFVAGAEKFLTGLQSGVDALAPAIEHLGPLLGAVLGAAGALAGTLGPILGQAISLLAPYVTDLINRITPMIPALGEIASAVIDGLGGALGFLMPILTPVIDAIVKGVQWISQFSGAISVLATAIGIAAAAWVAYKVIALIVTAVQAILNAVLFANPWGLIVLGIIALVAALVAAYYKFDWFKNAVDAVWQWIKGAISNTVTWFRDTAWPFLKMVLDWIAQKFVWLYQSVILPVWNWIKGAISGVITWLTSTALPWIQNAISSVGNVFVWLYEHIIKPIWSGIQTVISVYIAIIKGYFNILLGAVKILASVFVWLYQHVVVPVWNGIKVLINAAVLVLKIILGGLWLLIRDIIGPGFLWLYNHAVKPAFAWIRNALSVSWAFIRDKVFGPLKQGLQWVGEKFNSVKNWIVGIWNALKAGLAIGWNWIRDHVFGPVKQGLQWVGEKFDSIKNWALRIWNALKLGLQAGWNWIRDNVLEPLKRALDSLRDRFNSVKSKIADIWADLRQRLFDGMNAIKDRTITPFENALTALKDTFKKVKDGIGEIWDALKEKVREPVAMVVNKVINPFIGGYNDLNDFWKGDDLKEITGFHSGGHTGSGTKYQPAGIVHADEFVVKKASRRKFEHNNPGYLDHINATGELPTGNLRPSVDGLSAGVPSGPSAGLWSNVQTDMMRSGEVTIARSGINGGSSGEAVKAWAGQSALKVNLGSGGGPQIAVNHGSQGPWGHYSGNRIQINPNGPRGGDSTATLIHEIGHLLSLGHAGANSIMHPQMRGPRTPSGVDYAAVRSAWGDPDGSVRKYSADEINVGGGGFSFIDPINWLREKITGFVGTAKDTVTRQFANNNFLQMPMGIMSATVDSVVNAAKDAVSAYLNPFDGGGGGGDVEQWRDTAKKALDMTGNFSEGNLSSLMRRMNQESSGNAKAQNNWDVNAVNGVPSKGLMQVIQPTFDTHKFPGHDDIMEPLDNILASIRYTKATYPSLQAGWDRKGGYFNGGLVKIPQYDNGGMINRGVQLIDHQRSTPDYVLTDTEWRNQRKIADFAETQKDGQNGIVININGVEADPDEIARKVEDRMAWIMQTR